VAKFEVSIIRSYVNMDYFLLSTLRYREYKRLVISYDIACQWSRKLSTRCDIYPENPLSSSICPDILYLVPKFHLPAHISACQISYSFNLSPGVGRTDGEAPERGWAAANAIATSTREMGPGSRRDTLDDHFGDYNWCKITLFGALERLLPWGNYIKTENFAANIFLRKAEEAIQGRREHVDAFIEFDAALPEESTKAWTELCQEWETDRSKENPFRTLQTSKIILSADLHSN
jgi:hypothetical protein